MMKQFYLSMLVIISVACGYTIAEQPVEVDEPIKEQIEEQVSEPAVEAVQEQTAEEIIVEIFRPEHADLIALKKQGDIVIDGQMNESDWQQSDRTEPFTAPINGNSTAVENDPDYHTWAKVLWDEDNLYFGFEAKSPEKPFSYYTDRDSPLHEHDVVEIFLDIKGDMLEYAEYQASPQGIIADYYHTWSESPDFTADNIDWSLQAEAHKGIISWNSKNYYAAGAPLIENNKEIGFCVEMMVPVKELLSNQQLPEQLSENQGFYVNLIRYVHTRVGHSEMRKMQQLNWGPVLKGCPHISPMAMRIVRCDP